MYNCRICFEGEEYKVLQDYVIIVFSTAACMSSFGLVSLMYTRNNCLAIWSATICLQKSKDTTPCSSRHMIVQAKENGVVYLLTSMSVSLLHPFIHVGSYCTTSFSPHKHKFNIEGGLKSCTIIGHNIVTFFNWLVSG